MELDFKDLQNQLQIGAGKDSTVRNPTMVSALAWRNPLERRFSRLTNPSSEEMIALGTPDPTLS